MFCKNCGKEMNENQAVCLNCGVQSGQGTAFCQNCGKELPPKAAVCLGCGVDVRAQTCAELAGQPKWVMALLCFFLGGLGIHNFIMGENKKGIFKIIMSLLCGIGYIFVLIDFVKILTDKYVIDPNKLV